MYFVNLRTLAGGRELAALTSHVEEQVKSLLSLTTE